MPRRDAPGSHRTRLLDSVPRWVAFAAGFGGVTVGGAAGGLAVKASDPEWVSAIGTWFGGFGTAGAVGLAYVVFRAERAERAYELQVAAAREEAAAAKEGRQLARQASREEREAGQIRLSIRHDASALAGVDERGRRQVRVRALRCYASNDSTVDIFDLKFSFLGPVTWLGDFGTLRAGEKKQLLENLDGEILLPEDRAAAQVMLEPMTSYSFFMSDAEWVSEGGAPPVRQAKA